MSFAVHFPALSPAGGLNGQVAPQADPKVHFSGTRLKKFKKDEAAIAAKALIAESGRLEIQPKKGFSLTEAEVAKRLERGKRLPLEGVFDVGVLYRDGRCVSVTSDSLGNRIVERMVMGSHSYTFERIMGFLHKRLETTGKLEMIPEAGLPVVIRQRDPVGKKAVQKYLEDKVIPHFNVNEEMSLADGKKEYVIETVTWPFLEDLMADHPLTSETEPLVQDLLGLPIFQVNAPLSVKTVEQALRDEHKELKRILAGLEVAREQYAGNLHLSEPLITAVIAGAIGLSGELGVHHFLHENPGEGVNYTKAGIRTALLSAIDLLENTLNSVGIVKSGLKANGEEFSRKGIWGDSSWGQILRHPFKSMKQTSRLFVKRGASSAVKGTLTGVGLSAAAGFGLSAQGVPLPARAALAGAGTMGTATGVPYFTRANLPHLYLATLKLMKDGKIPVPQTVATQEELKEYALSVAVQELGSRMEYTASAKAFTMIPFLSAGIIGSEPLLTQVGGMDPVAARKLIETVYMGTAPMMESGLRALLTAIKLYVTVPRRMALAEKLILDKPDQAFSDGRARVLGDCFADRWAEASVRSMSVLNKMPQLVADALPQLESKD